MEVYRLSRKKFSDSLSGKGAAAKGARWNSTGVEMIYTAANRSLAMAEVAVHFTLATLPSDYVMITVYIPDNISVQKLNISDLPMNWNAFPHPTSTQWFGDRFITDNKFCILQVPSAVTKGDFNILINPNHSESMEIKIVNIEDFPFGDRIFK
jgi:RES domain-containing protein